MPRSAPQPSWQMNVAFSAWFPNATRIPNNCGLWNTKRGLSVSFESATTDSGRKCVANAFVLALLRHWPSTFTSDKGSDHPCSRICDL